MTQKSETEQAGILISILSLCMIINSRQIDIQHGHGK